jgi:hypothetical protein
MAKIQRASERGISFVDIVVALALFGILSAIAVPSLTNAIEMSRLAQYSREVERELQIAKSRAVAKGRPMRVRFNCPSDGMYRMTELIGTVSVPAAADSALNRCSAEDYPFLPDNDPMTLPNLDGPIRYLGDSVSFGDVQTIEFWPDGTAHYDSGVNPWQMLPVAGITLTLTRKSSTSTISVNGLGKIQLHTEQ